MNSSPRRRWWRVAVPIVVIVLVAGGTGAWALRRSSASTTGGVTYRTASVTTGTIKQAVTASGTIEAADTEDLSFGSSGQVTGVYVVAGQRVAKGQRLASISSASLTSQVAQANATLAQSVARLDSDESTGASSAQINSDEATVTVAKAQLADAKTALAGAVLTSPIAGTVTTVGLTVGQQVSGSSGSGSSTGSGNGASSGNGSSTSSSSSASASSSNAIQVVSTGSYVVSATVDATDVALISKDDQVVITPTGSSTNAFGLVSSVGIVASTSSGVASFPVTITVTGSPAGLYPGSTADLSIVYKQLGDVLVVPTLAVQRSGGTSYVLVESNGGQVHKTITTGLSAGGSTQVLSGLAEGDVVLVAVPTGTGGTGAGTGTTNRGNRGTGGGFGGNGGGFGGAGGGTGGG